MKSWESHLRDEELQNLYIYLCEEDIEEDSTNGWYQVEDAGADNQTWKLRLINVPTS